MEQSPKDTQPLRIPYYCFVSKDGEDRSGYLTAFIQDRSESFDKFLFLILKRTVKICRIFENYVKVFEESGRVREISNITKRLKIV